MGCGLLAHESLSCMRDGVVGTRAEAPGYGMGLVVA